MLWARAEREGEKKKAVLVDGMPKLLHHDSFYAAVENYEEDSGGGKKKSLRERRKGSALSTKCRGFGKLEERQ